MFNQIRRIWADTGREDKDFAAEELKLKEALQALRTAANDVSRASGALLDLINSSPRP